MSLLGIDIGTTNCKGLVISNDGIALAECSREYTANNLPHGRVEIDAEVFWEATVEIIRTLAGAVSEKDPVESLAISSHGETIIPVDKSGDSSGPAIMNSDCRAVKEAKWWAGEFGVEEIYEITGSVIHPIFAMTKILWLKKHEPGIYSRTCKYLGIGDFILQKMGLPAYIDYSLASRFMAFDIRRKMWSEEILSCIGLKEDMFGMPVCAGQAAGRLDGKTARILGLKTGVLVAVGGHDQPCGALGAGAVNCGDVSDSAGTFECVTAVGDFPTLGRKSLRYSLNSYCHVVPDKYVTLAFFPSGIMLKWFRNNILQDDFNAAKNTGMSIYGYFDENSPEGPTGICITPYIIGSYNPNWNSEATCTITGLTINATKNHIYKALLEGNCCELDINLRILEGLIGKLKSLRVTGGGAKSELWLKMRADITGKRILTLAIPESVCLGAALLAGIAAGTYRNAQEAVSKVVRLDREYLPSPSSQRAYAPQKSKYKTICLH